MVSGLNTRSNFQIPRHSPTGLPSVGGFGYLTVYPLFTNYGASHTQRGLIINGGFTDTDTGTGTGRNMVHHCPGVRLSAALFASLLCLLAITVPSAAKSPQLPCAADPFADPKADPCNPLKYIASNALTSVAFGGCSDSNFSSRVAHPQLILGLIIATALVQTWYMFRIGGKFMSSMVIGEYSE